MLFFTLRLFVDLLAPLLCLVEWNSNTIVSWIWHWLAFSCGHTQYGDSDKCADSGDIDLHYDGDNEVNKNSVEVRFQ
jgi:hypothetical protein